MRGVVVDRERHVGEHHRLEVEGREHLVEPGRALVILQRTRILLRRAGDERRPGDQAGERRERAPPGAAVSPTMFDSRHLLLIAGLSRAPADRRSEIADQELFFSKSVQDARQPSRAALRSTGTSYLLDHLIAFPSPWLRARRRCAVDPQHRSIERGEIRLAAHRHVARELGLQHLDDTLHAGRAVRRQPPHHRPPDQHRLRAERQRLDDVGAAPEAAVGEDGRAPADRIDNRRQRQDRRRRPPRSPSRCSSRRSGPGRDAAARVSPPRASRSLSRESER